MALPPVRILGKRVKTLRSQQRVISVDLPGYGLTGPFIDDDYRPSHYAHFIAELLDKLGVKHAVVVGNSFGGQVALDFALDEPTRVDKLILIDALGYPRNSISVPIGFRVRNGGFHRERWDL
ncbi:MAG: alpha/beta hydrolase [Arenimonas sp.]